MIRAAIACAVLAAVAPAACRTGPDRNRDLGKDHYQLAEGYFRQGNLLPALDEGLKAAQADPDNPEAHHLLGLIHLAQAVQEEEFLERRQCLEGVAAREQRAAVDDKLRQARDRFQDALRACGDSDERRRCPSWSQAHNSLAVVALRRKDYDAAVTHAEAALSNPLYRETHIAHGNLGEAFYRKGDLGRADLALRRALFDQPEFCLGRYRLARVEYERKRIDEAIAALDRVVADPRCPIQEAWHLLGLCRGLAGRHDQARAALDRCVELAPDSCLAAQCRRDRKLME